MMNSTLPQIDLNTRVRHRRVGNDGVVVCMQNGSVLVVNEVGSYIIEQLSQKNKAPQIIKALCDEFDVTKEQAQADFDLYIEQLLQNDVISINSATDEGC